MNKAIVNNLTILVFVFLFTIVQNGIATAEYANELSIINSRFELVTDRQIEEKVWAVVQARIIPEGQVQGGFCGTAWIAKRTPDTVYFVSAAHVFDHETFNSKKGNPIRVLVYLVNIHGYSILVEESSVKLIKDKDLAIIPWKISTGKETESKFQPLPHPEGINSADDFTGVSVYNLGFPNRIHSKVNISFQNDRVSFDKGICRQKGKIFTSRLVTSNTANVNLKNTNSFILGYASEEGFSGGPLFLEGTNEVIGLMSMVIPKNGEPPTQCIAIHVSEVLKSLQSAKNKGVRLKDEMGFVKEGGR